MEEIKKNIFKMTENLSNPQLAYFQERVCQGPTFNISNFAQAVPRANIDYCLQKFCSQEGGEEVVYTLAKKIKEVKIEYCYCNSSDMGKRELREFVLSDEF